RTSMRALAGPVSKAIGSRSAAMTVMFAIPPRYSTAVGAAVGDGSVASTDVSDIADRRSEASITTSGTPGPPAATSRERTSVKTGTPKQSTMQAGYPRWKDKDEVAEL